MVTTRSSRRVPPSTQPIKMSALSFDAFQQASSAKFDEAQLAAFLDLSEFTTGNDHLVVPESYDALPSYTNAFGTTVGSATGALRPVDDSLLDSPLGLELSPGSLSSASSFSGSPYDFGSAADYTSPLLSSYNGSPLLADSIMGCTSVADLPSLFAPAPPQQALPFAMDAAWYMAQQPALPALPAASTITTTAIPMQVEEDVKPVVSPTLTSTLEASTNALLFDFAAPAPAPTSSATTAAERKTAAQLKKEAAAQFQEKPFVKDSFKGFRNTKKPPVDYDAPTLPKNYLTESTTSRKRAGPGAGKSSSSPAPPKSKRARTSTPAAAVELPPTAAEPIPEELLDEEQLSAIELKRRSNTLAARRSRQRKAAYVQELNDEISRLKSLNEQLIEENARLKEGRAE